MLGGHALRCVLLVGLAALVAGDAPVGVVLLVTAAAAAAGAIDRLAMSSLLPPLVGESRLAHASALAHTLRSAAAVAGPALAAALLVGTSRTVPFLVAAALFALAAGLVFAVPRSAAPANRPAAPRVRCPPTSSGGAPFVAPLLAIVATTHVVLGALTVQLVVIAAQRFDDGAAAVGYLVAVGAAGGLASAFVNTRVAGRGNVTAVIVGAAAVWAATEFGYAYTDRAAAALAIALVGGVALVLGNVVTATTIARVCSPATRVAGGAALVSTGAGAILAAVLLEEVSLRTTCVVVGGIALAATAAALAGMRGLDAASRHRVEQLATRLAVVEQVAVTREAPRSVLERLAGAAQVCPLPPGVDVVVQGAPAHAFYAVIDGSVVVHRDGEEVIRLARGDHFGERGLLDAAPRNATVTTAVQCTLLRLDGDVLLDALRAAPRVRAAMDRSNSVVDDPTWVPS